MPKTLIVNYTKLDEFGDNLIESIKDIETCLTELQTEIDSLTSSAWQGTDSAQYKTKVNKTLDNLSNIKSDIEKYGKFAKSTVGTYKGIVARAKSKLG
ncbi:MAG: hypothetical protein J6A52_07820 [Bacilli bacterium]|nr:hypothetical protein [Bacilli bacterium]